MATPRKTHLKIKIHTLADEARHIRREEQKLRKQQKWAKDTGNTQTWADVHGARMDLADHRRGIVRSATRECLLAYGYLRGMPYKRIEASCRPGNEPDSKAIAKIIKRFGGDSSGLDDWLAGKEFGAQAA